MKRLFATIVAVVLGSLVFACKYVVPQFSVTATDGKVYTTTGFLGKPTLFVFLKKGAKGREVSDLNSLARQLKGSVQVLGFLDGDPPTTKVFANKFQVGFPLGSDGSGSIRKAFGVKSNLAITFTASKSGEPRFPQMWDGCSRSTVEEVLAGMEHHGVKVPKVVVAGFPKQ